ncbi:hypothetical protein B0H16DRAFT_1463445 [Mycena metata]|uniref:Uncharacterized protein n=1 Tax=Mycena metata TaxID=1033252 RepID=A0AAD7N493_9AGAR|nr:hypothetical protein B0H16DRAFT_1463445 [Mycena metata]
MVLASPELILSLPDLGPNLEDREVQWVQLQPFLEGRGYMLRPRIAGVKGEKPWECEDSVGHLLRPSVLDATRISDGAQVVLKIVDRGSTSANPGPTTEYYRVLQSAVVPVVPVVKVPNSVVLQSGRGYYRAL